MNRYDYTLRCVSNFTSYNGIQFYKDELYYADEEYSMFELCYQVYNYNYRFLSDITYTDLYEYFKVIPSVLDDVTNLFNKIMDE
jgi:hypothetical protein